jgi:hypothetical protein
MDFEGFWIRIRSDFVIVSISEMLLEQDQDRRRFMVDIDLDHRGFFNAFWICLILT